MKKKGSLKVNIIQCMTVGPPTVGKTTLKEQLIASPKRKRKRKKKALHSRPPSSPVCEKVKKVQVTLDNNEWSSSTFVSDKYTWKNLTFDEEVIGCLKTMSQNVKEDEGLVGYCVLAVIMYVYSIIAPLADGDNKKVDLYNNILIWLFCGSAISIMPLGFFALLYCLYSCWIKYTTNNLIDRDAVIRESLQKNDIKKVQPLFDQTITIYFRDCGGQPEFHEVLPALVSHSTLFLLVFNLSEDFDKQYKVTYKTSDGEVSKPYVSSFTVRQAIFQSLASINSIGNYLKPQKSIVFRIMTIFNWLWEKVTNSLKNKLKLTVAKVLIIGTHKDVLGKQAKREIFHINKQLEYELKGTDWYSKDMIIPSTKGGRLLLAINAFNGNDVQKVKDLVVNVAFNGNYRLEIPVPWLALEFCIRKLGKRVISIKECRRLAQEFNISLAGELDAALWFLHNKVGTLRYFKNVPELENKVITDPQLLFDIVTDLILNTFSFGKHIQTKREHDRFHSSGRFTKHHLEKSEAVKEKLLSVEQVIAVLEHLVIIAPVGINESNEQEYFLPCVLVHASLPSTPLLHNDSDIPPLLITFKCHYTPRGIFSSLIAKILLDGKDEWKLSSKEIKRNQVKFCLIKSGHIVTIINFFKFLEISVKPPRGLRKKENIHPSIQHYISQCLAYVRDQLNYTVTTAEHLFGFYCNEIHDSYVDPHLAECNLEVKPTYKKCCVEGSLTASLLPKEKMWFHEECK